MRLVISMSCCRPSTKADTISGGYIKGWGMLRGRRSTGENERAGTEKEARGVDSCFVPGRHIHFELPLERPRQQPPDGHVVREGGSEGDSRARGMSKARRRKRALHRQTIINNIVVRL